MCLFYPVWVPCQWILLQVHQSEEHKKEVGSSKEPGSSLVNDRASEMQRCPSVRGRMPS